MIPTSRLLVISLLLASVAIQRAGAQSWTDITANLPVAPKVGSGQSLASDGTALYALASPNGIDLTAELASVEAAAARGYFLPDEDEFIRLRYSQYLGLRAAMLETLAELGAMAGRGEVEWRDRLPVFAAAFAAACVLMRADGYLVALAAD